MIQTKKWLEKTTVIAWFSIAVFLTGPLIAFAADVLTPMVVKTKSNGDVVVELSDGTTPSQKAAVSAGGAVKVDGSAVTQPVSGTVTVQQSTAANLKVDLSGTAANATAVKVDGSAVTQPISGSITATVNPPTSPQLSAQTSASLAAGGNVTLNCTDITTGKTGKLMQFTVSASVPVKAEIGTFSASTLTDKVVLFSTGAKLELIYTPIDKTFITQAGGSGKNFAVKLTNMDNAQAADVYATCLWDEI